MPVEGPNQLPGIGPAPGAEGIRRGAVRPDPRTSFAEILRESIREVNDLQQQADEAIRELTLGRTENVTAVVTQVEKADLAFRALLAVRNKLIDAYEEINRLRV